MFTLRTLTAALVLVSASTVFAQDRLKDAPRPDHKYGPWILAADGTDVINFNDIICVRYSDQNGDWYYFPADDNLLGPYWWGTHEPKDPPAPNPPDDGGDDDGGGGGFWAWFFGLFS